MTEEHFANCRCCGCKAKAARQRVLTARDDVWAASIILRSLIDGTTVPGAYAHRASELPDILERLAIHIMEVSE